MLFVKTLQLKGFPIVLISFFFLWGVILLLLKFVGGIERVGCAAGGETIHMTALRENGVRRWQRRQRMIRSWRIQNIFAISAFGLIAFSFVFVNQGLTPFLHSLDDVTTVTNVAQTRTRHGMHLAHLLSSHMHNLRPYLDLNITKLCPNYDQTILETQFSLSVTAKEIVHAAKEMDYFLVNDMDPFLHGLDAVAAACGSIDSAITTAKKNDWMIRLFLTSVNIINMFLIAGVFLTRNKIKSDLYQDVLGGICLPAFVTTMIFAIMVLCLVSAVGMVNAGRFCNKHSQTSPHSLSQLTNFVCLAKKTFVLEVKGTGLHSGRFLNWWRQLAIIARNSWLASWTTTRNKNVTVPTHLFFLATWKLHSLNQVEGCMRYRDPFNTKISSCCPNSVDLVLKL